VAGLCALAAFTLWRHSFFTGAQLPLLLPAQKVAALVGFGAPARRILDFFASFLVVCGMTNHCDLRPHGAPKNARGCQPILSNESSFAKSQKYNKKIGKT
jgi:hypothetical protein